MMCAVLAIYLSIRALPDRPRLPDFVIPISYRAVDLPPASYPFRFAGAWKVTADDDRFGGISALTLDRGRFLSVSDLGAVIRFDLPGSSRPAAWIADLRAGPGPYGKKWARDAESLARDPRSRGWWVGYEQRHSLWLYDRDFDRALARVDLSRANWRDNRGAEGLLSKDGGLLVLAENGRDAVQVAKGEPKLLKLHAEAEIAEAAPAPDGSNWALLRGKSLEGVEQWIAPLERSRDGYRLGPRWPLPKKAFDNFEGMTIEARPDGSWRFWLVTDDGHRFMARTLLVALDLDVQVKHGKSPTPDAGLSMKPENQKP